MWKRKWFWTQVLIDINSDKVLDLARQARDTRPRKRNRAISKILTLAEPRQYLELLGPNSYLSESQFRKILSDAGPLNEIDAIVLVRVLRGNDKIPADVLTKMAMDCRNPAVLHEVSQYKNTPRESKVIAVLNGAQSGLVLESWENISEDSITNGFY